MCDIFLHQRLFLIVFVIDFVWWSAIMVSALFWFIKKSQFVRVNKMNNIILYLTTVLIWGTTWFAIKLQVGYAPNEISILYRATLAALCLYVWCKFKGISLKHKMKDHLFFCLLGLAMFSLHLLFVYKATTYIVSGVVAVVFSCLSFLSILNNYIFFRIKPQLNVLIGVLFGICVN